MDRIHDLNWFKAYHIALNSLNSTSHSPLSQINIFTDGSKTSQHTGAGFVIYRQGVAIAEGSRRLPPLGAAAYQLGNTSSRTITEVKQR